MWYPGNLPYAVLIVVAFYRWFDSGQTDLPVEEDAPTSIPYNEGAPTAAPSGWSEGRTT
jgi:hypothetical protein